MIIAGIIHVWGENSHKLNLSCVFLYIRHSIPFVYVRYNLKENEYIKVP
jgi:hypothetical protein